jgi:protein TonB
MKYETTGPSWDDVIFESRNKEYGAYYIRKSYDQNVAKGFFTALLIAVCVFGAIQVASLLNAKIVIAPPLGKGTDIILPPLIIPDPPAIKQEVRSERKSNPDFFRVATMKELAEIPTVEQTTPSTIGGEAGKTGVSTSDVNQGQLVVAESPSIVKPLEIFTIAEIMPEYEGGLKAMARFLSKQINYPANARAMGQEGTVYVQFVVNTEGQVVDIEVIKGVCATLEREAVRVVALMTKWKPGLQHNVPVNVRMVLPIKFQLEQ